MFNFGCVVPFGLCLRLLYSGRDDSLWPWYLCHRITCRGAVVRLHDLPKTTPPLLDLYESQMENITQILVGSGAKHVLYALTTPFEADHAPGCGPYVRMTSAILRIHCYCSNQSKCYLMCLCLNC